MGIIGATGSGKTTLVQHFNGLLRPTAGKVIVEGADLAAPGISLTAVRRRVGLLFQYPEHQLFETTVFNDISFVLRQAGGLPADEMDRRVRSACSMAGLAEEFLSRSPYELSRGEMRRAALAGIMAQDPPVVVLDEPGVGLDGAGKREILARIRGMADSGKTVIIISHDVEEIAAMTDRLVVLEKGRILIDGAPDEVFEFLLPSGKAGFLVPSFFRFLARLRSEGWDIPPGIRTTEGAAEAIDDFLGSRAVNAAAEN